MNTKPFIQYDSDSNKVKPLGFLGKEVNDTKVWTELSQTLAEAGKELKMVLPVTKLDKKETRGGRQPAARGGGEQEPSGKGARGALNREGAQPRCSPNRLGHPVPLRSYGRMSSPRRLIPELTASRRAEPGSHEQCQSRETKTRSAASLPVHRQLETGWIRLCGELFIPAQLFSPFSARVSSPRHRHRAVAAPS
ncbi:hypothetical protein ABFV05_007527 [Capra hircus]